jgi:hypothetical protein
VQHLRLAGSVRFLPPVAAVGPAERPPPPTAEHGSVSAFTRHPRALGRRGARDPAVRGVWGHRAPCEPRCPLVPSLPMLRSLQTAAHTRVSCASTSAFADLTVCASNDLAAREDRSGS